MPLLDFVEDWQVDGEMASIDRDEVQRIVSGQLKAARVEIVSDVVAALKPRTKTPRWNHPWAINLGSAIIGGLVVFGATVLASHTAKDRHSEIADEVRQQISGDTPNQNARIAAEVGRQVTPIHQQLETLSQDIGKIKDNLHIARNEPSPSNPSPVSGQLIQLARMDQGQFSQNLAKMSGLIAAAQKNGEISDFMTIDAIQKKLAMIPLDTPEAIRTAFAVINYASFVRERMGLFPNANAVRSQQCQLVQIDDGKSAVNKIYFSFDHNTIDGCALRLDGLSLKNSTIANAVVSYDGGAVKLENVRFVNCLFATREIPANTPGRARSFVKEILVKGVGAKPSFTVTSG